MTPSSSTHDRAVVDRRLAEILARALVAAIRAEDAQQNGDTITTVTTTRSAA